MTSHDDDPVADNSPMTHAVSRHLGTIPPCRGPVSLACPFPLARSPIVPLAHHPRGRHAARLVPRLVAGRPVLPCPAGRGWTVRVKVSGGEHSPPTEVRI